MRDRKEIDQLENMEFREIINSVILIFCFFATSYIKRNPEIKEIAFALLLYLVVRFIMLIVLFCQKTDF